MQPCEPLKRTLRTAAVVLLALLAAQPAGATIYTWAPAGGGLTNSSVNWSPSGVPGLNDDTRFFQTLTYTITTASPADTFATVWAGSSGGHPQFSCADPLRVRNYFNVDGGAAASVISGFARAGWFTVGVGSLTITGNGTEAAATNPTATTYVGTASGFASTLTVTGGAGFAAPLIYVPEFTGATGTLSVAGHPTGGVSSNLHVEAVNGAPFSGSMFVGNQGVGDLEVFNGGTATVDEFLELGTYATGKLHMYRTSTLVPLPTLSALYLTIGENNISGSPGGQGTCVIDQGLLRVNNVSIGDDDGGSPDTLRMNGGTFWVPVGFLMNASNTGILDLRGGTLVLDPPFYLNNDGVSIQQATPVTISGASPTLTIYAGGQGGQFDSPTTSITTTSPLSLALGRNAGGTLRVLGDGFPGDRYLTISGGVVVADSLSGTGTCLADTAAGISFGGPMTVGPGNGVVQVRRQSMIAAAGESEIVGSASTGGSLLVSDSLSQSYFGGLDIGGTAAAAVPGMATVTIDSSAGLSVSGPPLRVWNGGGRLVLGTHSTCAVDSLQCSGEVQISGGTLISDIINFAERGPIKVSGTGSIHGIGVVQGLIRLIDPTATLAILGTDPVGGTLVAGDSTASDGFTSAGKVDVEKDTLVLLNHGQAPLGHVVLGGGTLRLPQGGHLRTQDVLEGTAGRIEGDVLDDGVIHPTGGIDVAGHVTCLSGAITGSYLNVVPGGELSVKGNQSGTLHIGGQLDMGPVPASLTLSSTLTLLSSGAVTMRIGSRASHVQDTLALTQNVALTGTLDLRVWKPAPPVVGDTLTLITAPSISGTFTAVTIDGSNASAFVQPIYSATSVKVVILKTITGVPIEPPVPVAVAVPLRFAAIGPPASAVLELDLPVASNARIAVFDIGGRRVATLNDGTLAPGRHRFSLQSAGLPSGVYLAQARVGDSHAATVLKARLVRLR